MNEYLPDELLQVHRVLDRDGIPHAFGGANALAHWSIPRATRDIDVNNFLPVSRQDRVLEFLGTLFRISDLEAAKRQLIIPREFRRTF